MCDDSSPDRYTVQTFSPGLDGENADARTTKWFEAVYFAFHDGTPDAASLGKFTSSYLNDQRVLTGVYSAQPPAGAWGADVPVATYATLSGTLNVGGGKMLKSHLITAVTVRSTHRRRGLLRRMISADLKQAKSNGLSMAALTASEATIYGRFGFGAATFTRRVALDVKERYRVHGEPSGTVEVADRAQLQKVAPDIFDRFHQWVLGSMKRQDSYRYRVSGMWSDEKAEEDKSVRAAFHYDDDGALDGYVSYKFSGWDTEPYTIKVLDLVTASESAYLELWRYLGSIDLVERITFSHAAVREPLPWALSDRRGYKVLDEEDVLWLRILDPVEALSGKYYYHDGRVSVRVEDPLGIAGGSFEIEANAGRAQVSVLNLDAEVQVELSINALSSLYLGGVDAGTLAAAGQLKARTPEDLAALRQLFATPQPPHCITHF